MQEKHLFEYAVIRIVPKVEREEFFNAGVILYCAGQKFLKAQYKLDKSRLRLFCEDIELETLQNNLDAMEKICEGAEGSGAIGKLSIAERFRWLTATRSTIVQCSKVHPGFCTDASATLQELYDKLVC